MALRVADGQVALGEDNGSDEAQLWKIDGGMLVPANKPSQAMAVSKDGTLVMADVAKVKGKKASRFDIRRSAYAGFMMPPHTVSTRSATLVSYWATADLPKTVRPSPARHFPMATVASIGT